MKHKKAPKHKELKPADLRWQCNPDIFEFKTTDELEPIEGILGQERALNALRVGMDLRSSGYNIYIAGLSGTGKTTTVKKILEKVGSQCPLLYDYAYVNNFKNEDRPILLTFMKGKAKVFKQDLSSSIELLKTKIPLSLESHNYINQKNKLLKLYSDKEQKLMSSFQEKLKKENFQLGQVKQGEMARPDIFPIIDNKAVPIYQLDELVQQKKITQEEAEKIIESYREHQPELQSLFKKGLTISQEFQAKLQELERKAAEEVVKGVIENLEEKYTGTKVVNYLEQVEISVLDNLQIFKGQKPQGDATPEGFYIDYFKMYDVNIILDNSDSNYCPVIIETSPTYANLFGTIEKIHDGRGGWYTDFTKIKAGSMLRANGGYLVLNVNHVFEEAGAWKTLKRVLIYGKLEIQDIQNLFQISTSIIQPEPIEIDTKVILVGSQVVYTLLSEYEDDFNKIFKIKADFDYEIKRTDEVLVEYARVIKKLIKEEGLREFHKTAIAKLIEIGARYAGQKNKLTTRFSVIADIAREANFWASEDGASEVMAIHVRQAFEALRDRHGMPESKVDDMIKDKMIMIDTDGERIGQINGLAVYGSELYSFGRPTRITSTISLGSGNIINVERESGMSGKTYNKGVLIITGYFKETFGKDHPLAFNANLVFEQSYGGIDGDSASCAEIFALLSTLSEVPIKQSIGITGSLNQKGDVQPIGGVNEKIEGFFDVCRSRGLTGKQGVVIPVQNVKDLMLREDVVQAVEDKRFHIWSIERVEEGVEILTGIKAGKHTGKNYEANTMFGLVEKKIKDLYAKSKPKSSRAERSKTRVRRAKSRTKKKK
jgi:lon-related putative ATP-dependent protease